MQIERIAVQTALQERADLLGDPLDPGEYRQADQAWPAGNNSDVARYAHVHSRHFASRSLSSRDRPHGLQGVDRRGRIILPQPAVARKAHLLSGTVAWPPLDLA